MFCFLYVQQYGTRAKQNKQKGEVECGKQQDVLLRAAVIVFGVFAVGDKAGQGRNQRTHAADVDAV